MQSSHYCTSLVYSGIEFFVLPSNIINFGSKRVVLNCCYFCHQRWSRGHKARGQGQGHKKIPRPRPRTTFPRTDPLEARTRMLEAKAKDQGHRRKRSPKKSLQKSFSGDHQFIGVPRIFGWRRPKPQIT